MGFDGLSRRAFLGQAALAAGVMAVGGSVRGAENGAGAVAAEVVAKRTARDLVMLGKTGLKVSRLGLGLGSGNGSVQVAQGKEAFNGMVKHAFDQGITMLDTAAAYRTYTMLGDAIKGLPREKLFIQSKIEGPEGALEAIDKQRQVLKTDYVDSMLVHVQFRENWVETWKRALEDFDKALEKKWILSKGVSCHSLPALRAAIASDWSQVHLVRVNPQGVRIDNEKQVVWAGGVNPVEPVLGELKKMKEKGRGVIGMKIFGNGEFKTDADREKSARFAMGLKEVDSVVIGFADIKQLDAGIALLDKVLAEAV